MNDKKNINVKELLYLIAIGLLVFCSMSNTSLLIKIPRDIYLLTQVLVAIIFTFKILQETYQKRDFFWIIPIGLIFSYITFKLDDYSFIINFLAMIAIKNTSIKKVVMLDIVIRLFFIITHGGLYLINYCFDFSLIENFIYSTVKGVSHMVYFTNPNALGGLVFFLVIDILYLAKRVNLKVISFATIIITITYVITKSRTPVYIFAIFLIMMAAYKLMNKEKFDKILHFLSKNIVLILSIITFICVFYGASTGIKDSVILSGLNTLFSNRLGYSVTAYQMYGFHLLPNTLSLELENFLIIDNFYVRSFISYGSLILLSIWCLTRRIPKKGNTKVKFIVILFAIYLFFELFSFQVGRALPLLFIADAILNQKKKVVNTNENESFYS